MKLTFNDLFQLNNDTKTVSPKRPLRLGSLKLEPELVLSVGATDPLGFDIATWFPLSFDVSVDHGVFVITRIHSSPIAT